MTALRGIEERLAACVAIDHATGCWNWTGAKSKGYGLVHYEGSAVQVHRLSYEIHVGAIPDGRRCRVCGRKRCQDYYQTRRKASQPNDKE